MDIITSNILHILRLFSDKLKYNEGVERKAIFPPINSSSSFKNKIK